MVHDKSKYWPFSGDAQRLATNLEQTYRFWLSVRQLLKAWPASFYWAERAGNQYLYTKQNGTDNSTSLGPCNPQTEQQFATFTGGKKQALERAASADALIQISRKLDIEGLLGADLIVVGTNAFSAYEWTANAIFPAGNEETLDFDLAWCRNTPASLTFAGIDPEKNRVKRCSVC